VSGPSHAEEVARRMPTTVVAASSDKGLALRVQDLLTAERFRVYTNADPLGVELGGALKNVVSIAGGIVDGLGFGDNTKAALLPRGAVGRARAGAARGRRRGGEQRDVLRARRQGRPRDELLLPARPQPPRRRAHRPRREGPGHRRLDAPDRRGREDGGGGREARRRAQGRDADLRA